MAEFREPKSWEELKEILPAEMIQRLKDHAKILADDVWRRYTSTYGTPRKIKYLELQHLTDFFVRACAERMPEDPFKIIDNIDFFQEIFEDATYYELQDKIIARLNQIAVPPPEPIEISLEEAAKEVEKLGKRVREEDLKKHEKVRELEEEIERLSRNLEKVSRQLKLVTEQKLAAQREVERLRAELEKAKAPTPAPAPPPPTPPAPPAPRPLTDKEVEELRRLWELEIRRLWGKYPRDAALYFDVELLPTIKGMSYEKARETVIREAGAYTPAAPPPPTVVPPRPPTAPTPTPAYEEGVARPPVGRAPPPKVAPPGAPIEPMPFPRRLASSEIERFWDAFRSALWEAGIDPEDPYAIRHFIEFRDAWHHDWLTVLRRFNEMIEDIKERRLPPTYPRVPTPVAWKELPRDAVLHLLATKVYKNINQLIEALNFHGVYVTPEEVREIVKKEWRKVPRDSWFAVIPKDYLCEVLGISPEELPD